MTTTQVLLICVTVVVVVLIVATTRLKVRRAEIAERSRENELAAVEKVRSHETRRLELHNAAPASARVGPEVGAMLAVHTEERVIRGTLDDADTSTYVVLVDAAVIAGKNVQPLGGRQLIPTGHVTQIQEL